MSSHNEDFSDIRMYTNCFRYYMLGKRNQSGIKADKKLGAIIYQFKPLANLSYTNLLTDNCFIRTHESLKNLSCGIQNMERFNGFIYLI